MQSLTLLSTNTRTRELLMTLSNATSIAADLPLM